MIQILFYIYVGLLTIFLSYLLWESYYNTSKTCFIKCVCNVSIQLLGLIYFTLIKNYAMVGITGSIIVGHMVLVGIKLKRQLDFNKRNITYNNLQFDNQIFEETGIGSNDFVNPINYGLEDDLDASFEYNLSDEYNV